MITLNSNKSYKEISTIYNIEIFEKSYMNN